MDRGICEGQGLGEHLEQVGGILFLGVRSQGDALGGLAEPPHTNLGGLCSIRTIYTHTPRLTTHNHIHTDTWTSENVCPEIVGLRSLGNDSPQACA